MNIPYGLIPITLAIAFLYLISWGLAQMGEIRLISHRRIWNTLLLITFLVTGLLGIFMVIQINYRIEIPWIKKAVKWHVDFGIAMTGIVILHLVWHLRYYAEAWSDIRHAPVKAHSKTDTTLPVYTGNIGKKGIIAALAVLGFSCILSQLIIIREFLGFFQGNELIIGMILCSWMLLTASGSRFGQSLVRIPDQRKILLRLLLLQGLLPAISVSLLYLLEQQIFPPGMAKGFVTAFLFCMVLLTPLCLVSGMLFTVLSYNLSGISGRSQVSAAYGWEAGGSLVAGLLFSVLLVYLFSTFQIIAMILLVNVVLSGFLFADARMELKYYLMTGIPAILACLFLVLPVDKLVRSIHYRDQELVYFKDTPYGNISVTKTAGQYNFFENNTLLFSTENKIQQEEAAHFALLQHPKPERVLIVSGGITGMTNEVMKYHTVNRMDYFEINPWLVEAERRFINRPAAEILHLFTRDARRYIKESDPAYDVIVVNTPDPSNAQINRYYTKEFFSEAKNAIRNNGIFMTSLSPTVNYMGGEAKEVNQLLYNTLKEVFRTVEVIPGERNYFIASNGPLRLDIVQAIQTAGIKNDYVQSGYIDDDLLLQNNRQIMNEITSGDPKINLDLEPRAYFLQIRYWLTIFHDQTGTEFMLAILLFFVLMAVVVKNMSRNAVGIFAGGFAGASSEFLILIIFQSLYGYVYQMLGIIIAFYMAGLTVGTGLGIRLRSGITIRNYLLVQVILLFLVMMIPITSRGISGLNDLPVWAGQAVLFIMTAAIAFATGLEFNIGTRLEKKDPEKVAGNFYGIDLAGAAFGTILVSLFCFPLLGLFYTCLLMSVIILAGILVLILP
jgi:spermidine synthase